MRPLSDGNGQIIRAGRGAETIETWLNSNLDQIKLALPRGQQAERLARVFVTEVQRVPGLIECSPSSLLAGFLQASQCGLEIGAHLGQAYLVPFRVKGVPTATLIIGYRGLCSLAYNSGIVTRIMARHVLVGDLFDYQLGSSPSIQHRPIPKNATAELEWAYAIVHIAGAAEPLIELMDRDEIDAIKARSRGAARNDGPWHTDYNMMARKTVLRRACKTTPQSATSRMLHAAIEIDEAADSNLNAPRHTLVDLPELPPEASE
jgi:recombination protein RecT